MTRSTDSSPIHEHRALQRTVGLGGATMLGLGSIVGTGVFVSIGLGADAAGGWVLLATPLAALLAACNALSSAQLAAAHPVSGGTYEYAHRLLRPWIGFGAGWLFLCAKSASAATAALGFGGYTLTLLQIDHPALRAALPLLGIALLTSLVLSGLRRSSTINTAIVAFTILSLLALIVAALATRGYAESDSGSGPVPFSGLGLLEATALMFVAYTGYGRIATLGEEVRDPQRIIPRAIILTLLVSAALYLGVAWGALRLLGSDGLGQATHATGAPLQAAADSTGLPWLSILIAIGAISAMLGVLLNLILGLSRVVLAMARRGDAPGILAGLDRSGQTPVWSTLLVGLAIAAIAASGSIELAWSLSAYTVLLYYAVTNAAALALPPGSRLYPRWIAWAGLLACGSLAWWVEARAWIAGLALLGVGFVLRWAWRRYAPARS